MAATVAVASRVVRAEVYARGARVTRRLELNNDAVGARELEVSGVTPHAVATSLRATVEGPGAVRGVHSRIVRQTVQDPAQVKQELEAARNQLRDLERELRWLHARRARLEGIAPQPRLWDEDAEGRPPPTRSPEARIADAVAVQHTRRTLLESVEAELFALETRRLDQALACARLEERLLHDPQQTLSRTVTVELEPGELLPHGLELTYVVPTARWWPAYTVRLDDAGQSARWQLEAFVCQLSGEAWEGVELSLATSDLISDARFPELPSLRLGRPRQPKRAFRAPPEGLDALFAGYDRDQALLERAAAAHEFDDRKATGAFRAIPADMDGFAAPSGDPFAAPSNAPGDDPFAATGTLDSLSMSGGIPLGMEDDELAMDLGMAGGAPPPPPASAPMRSESKKSAKSAKSSKRGGRSRDASVLTRTGSLAPSKPAPQPAPAWDDPDEWLDYDTLEMQGASGPHRGRLRPAAIRVPGIDAALQALLERQPPGNPADPLRARGSFDHRFVAAAPADVPSGLGDHRVRLLELRTAVTQRLRCVPVVEERVYREAELVNPCDAPLLAGPVEVFFDDAFLTRTRIDAVPRGGVVRFGLGEEERVRVVRRVTSEESAQGFLSGTTLVDHTVAFEVASQLGAPIELELLARVPQPDEDQAIEVLAEASTPTCEPYPPDGETPGAKGGRRFRLALEPGGSATCELRYRLSFSAKLEVEGGNVRD